MRASYTFLPPTRYGILAYKRWHPSWLRTNSSCPFVGLTVGFFFFFIISKYYLLILLIKMLVKVIQTHHFFLPSLSIFFVVAIVITIFL